MPLILPLPGGPVETVAVTIPADHPLARKWAEEAAVIRAAEEAAGLAEPEPDFLFTVESPCREIGYSMSDPAELAELLADFWPDEYARIEGAVASRRHDEGIGRLG